MDRLSELAGDFVFNYISQHIINSSEREGWNRRTKLSGLGQEFLGGPEERNRLKRH